MDQQFDFRGLLIKLQDCLSDNDRRRLHFIVGDTIPRHLRDDPTLRGTLSLLESLFDRAKISEQDFDYLIQAFREIHCAEGVKRLQEYQLAKQGSDRRQTIVSEIFIDNDEDGINIIKDSSTLTSTDNSKQHDSPSTDSSKQHESVSTESVSIEFDKQNINTENLPVTINSIKSEKKIVNINLTFIKQTLKSRLTTCQLILLILNILGIITIVIVTIMLKKQSCSIKNMNAENVFLIKEGSVYGEELGGDAFNDATSNLLTVNDQLVSINASWSFDTLATIKFTYSNGGASQHGIGDSIRLPLYSSVFFLRSTESFNGVTVYRGLRDIINPYKPNGTVIIVGLRFSTNRGRQSDLFGSSNGTEYNELYPDYTLSYVQGRSYAFIDALQFVWSKGYKQNTAALIGNP